MERFIKRENDGNYMQTFEELLQQENIPFSVSGHYFDSGMTFEELLQFYRERNLREEPNVKFLGQREGSKFFLDDLAVMCVYAPPDARMVQQAQQLGMGALKTHVDIHPGERYYQSQNGDLNPAQQELRLLIQHHLEHKIPATCYFPSAQEFQGINGV